MKLEPVICEKCKKKMVVDNQIDEDYVVFVLWRCSTCNHQFLERRYLSLEKVES